MADQPLAARSRALRWRWRRALACSTGVARLVAWAARRWFPRRLPYVWRQGVANLYRPHNRTVLLLVSLGLGHVSRPDALPDRERRCWRSFAAPPARTGRTCSSSMSRTTSWPASRRCCAPGARRFGRRRPSSPCGSARSRAGRWRSCCATGRRAGRGWALRREYRSHLPRGTADTEKIVAGSFVGRVRAGDRGGAGLASRKDWRRSCRCRSATRSPLTCRACRSAPGWPACAPWNGSGCRPNFFVVFPEGVLEAAPKFFVVAIAGAIAGPFGGGAAGRGARLSQRVGHRPRPRAADAGWDLREGVAGGAVHGDCSWR